MLARGLSRDPSCHKVRHNRADPECDRLFLVRFILAGKYSTHRPRVVALEGTRRHVCLRAVVPDLFGLPQVPRDVCPIFDGIGQGQSTSSTRLQKSALVQSYASTRRIENGRYLSEREAMQKWN